MSVGWLVAASMPPSVVQYVQDNSIQVMRCLSTNLSICICSYLKLTILLQAGHFLWSTRVTRRVPRHWMRRAGPGSQAGRSPMQPGSVHHWRVSPLFVYPGTVSSPPLVGRIGWTGSKLRVTVPATLARPTTNRTALLSSSVLYGIHLVVGSKHRIQNLGKNKDNQSF